MNTIKWLLGLDQGKLVIAMLMIATSALFIQNQVKERQKDELNLNFRTEMMRREDSCEAQRLKGLQDANRKMEEFLRVLIDKSRKAERVIDSTVHYNKMVIDSASYNVKKVKKLLNTTPHGPFPTNLTGHY